MIPRSIPTSSWSTRATGPRQFVVHEAFEITWWLSGSYASSFTPSTSVTSGSVAGALMMTFFAPAARCFAASSRFVNSPVDSTTTSAPASPHGSAPGSRSANTFSSSPSTIRLSSVYSTSPWNGPRIESYLSRWASVFGSVRSFTPTQSISAPRAWAARNTLRPMRPKPLMPAFKAMCRRPPDRSVAESIDPSGPVGRLVDVAVDHLDQEVASRFVCPRQMLGYHDRAMPAAGAADSDGQVRLALLLVGRQQVVEQRGEAVVEVADPVRVLDVVDHVRVEPGLLAQVRLVVGIRQEAHVEGEVRVARRAVLEAEGHEGDRELAGPAMRQHLVRHHAPQAHGREVARVDGDVGALLQRRQQRALAGDRRLDRPPVGQRVAPARLLEAVDQD